MSKISLQPNASGAGTFSIVAPDSNTNRTLTLPDESGAVLSDVSDIESQVKAATNASGSAPVFACRAWVNFDGTGTVAIRDSGNVSSITDNSTGQYTVNFTTAMPDSNYAVSFSGQHDSGTVLGFSGYSGIASSTSYQANSVNVNGSLYDNPLLLVAVFR